jgi:restriction endonuclease S subunit
LDSYSCKTVEDLSVSVQNFGAYSLCNFINFTDEGVPFLMTENIRHNYIDWNIQKYVDSESHKMLYKSHCHKGQVLVTMAGEYLGRVAVYDKDFVCSSNQAIAKVTLKEGVNPYLISTFLNTVYGQNQINRLKTLTGQPNINMSLIKSLRVPSFSTEFSNEIENVVNKSEKTKDQSQTLYRQAEELLLETIGLKNFTPSQVKTNIKSFKESFLATGRLDAEYYQPKYEDIENKIKQNNSVAILSDVLIKIDTGEYSEKYYQKDSTNNLSFYIRSTNIKNGLIEIDDNFFVPKQMFRKISQTGDIITARVGSIGLFGTITEEVAGSIYSDNVLCFSLPKEFIPEVYTLLFNSKYYFELIDKMARGSVQQRLNQETLKDLFIPIIDMPTQQQISGLIQESFALRKESERLLVEAKEMVEREIEEKNICRK